MADGTLKVGTITTSSGSGNIAIGSGVTLLSNTPAFEALMSLNQVVSDAVDTKAQFDTEVFDTHNAFDSTTNYRFTVPSGHAGKYFIYVVLNPACDTASTLALAYSYLYKNGSAAKVSFSNNSNNYSKESSLTMNSVLDLSVGDYLEVYGRSDVTSGIPRFTAQVGAGKIATFGAYKIGA